MNPAKSLKQSVYVIDSVLEDSRENVPENALTKVAGNVVEILGMVTHLR